jgi:myosin heavy subunit
LFAGEWTGAADAGCRALLDNLQIEAKQWQLGKTKIFIRHPETVKSFAPLLWQFSWWYSALVLR